jgi:hypothetical protein
MSTIKIITEIPDVLYRFNQSNENPYEEDTPAWHVYIDCCCTVSSGVVSVSKMMSEYDQNLDYYETYTSQLISDGILERIEK